MNRLGVTPDAPCLALDIGGTKIDTAIVSTTGEISYRKRIQTQGGDQPLIERVVALILETAEQTPFATVGIGCGGPISDGENRISPLNILEWRNFDLIGPISSAVKKPVMLDIDTKALALAEGVFGGARDLNNFVSMVVSTGIGGGVVIDGRLLNGAHGNAGHIGHVNVEPNGRLCGCGARGCLEAEASGTAIASITGKLPALADDDIRRRTGQMVGRAVGSVASLLDVEHFFVAGSVALGFGDDFFAAANEEAASVAQISFARGVHIQPSKLVDRGPLVGAACVGWRSQP
jgi:glucokinase